MTTSVQIILNFEKEIKKCLLFSTGEYCREAACAKCRTKKQNHSDNKIHFDR